VKFSSKQFNWKDSELICQPLQLASIISGLEQYKWEITEFVDGLSQCFNSSSESSRNLSSLQELDLYGNQMNVTIPESIGKLSMHVSLDLALNSWEGVLTEEHFQNLTWLKSLLLFTEVFAKATSVLDVKHDWVPPFKLKYIGLANVRMAQTFQRG
jgi:hypothetical protein